MVHVGTKQWFYRSDAEWHALAERLKLTACPHCKKIGTLIRHGCLHGLDETRRKKVLRARRVFCSNRRVTRPGCGRTFSVWLADKIRRLSLSTRSLWRFLQHAVKGSIASAIRAIDCQCKRSERTWQRIWQRFNLGQSRIRTALLARCPPPEPPPDSPRRPLAQVVAHLQTAFPDAECPITAFQQTTQTFFV